MSYHPIPSGPRTPWHARTPAILLGLLIFPPFGVWAAWRSSAWTRETRSILTVLGGLWLVIVAVTTASAISNAPKAQRTSPVVAAPAVQTPASSLTTAAAGRTPIPGPAATPAPSATRSARPPAVPGLRPARTASHAPAPLPVVTTRAPAPQPPAMHRRAPSIAGPDPGTTPGVDILSPSGRYYAAGQFCPNRDLGLTTHDALGSLITCVMVSGRPHWTYV